jgi:hypothetical protein
MWINNVFGWDRSSYPAHNDYLILMTPDQVPGGNTHVSTLPLDWTFSGDDPENPEYSSNLSYANLAAAQADLPQYWQD